MVVYVCFVCYFCFYFLFFVFCFAFLFSFVLFVFVCFVFTCLFALLLTAIIELIVIFRSNRKITPIYSFFILVILLSVIFHNKPCLPWMRISWSWTRTRPNQRLYIVVAAPLSTQLYRLRPKTSWLVIRIVCLSGTKCLLVDCCFCWLSLSKSKWACFRMFPVLVNSKLSYSCKSLSHHLASFAVAIMTWLTATEYMCHN